MLFKRIESEGLAHYSYLIGDGTDAVVIDPRRDCEVYIQDAAAQGLSIRHILETHRHEDFVVGSKVLSSQTGAEVWHADEHLTYNYGKPVSEGQTWKIGRLKLQVLHTPGHTLGSKSYLLFDPDGIPWVIFTGDALFAGDVGRVDFMGMDRAAEMAGLLYDSLFDMILTVGDGVIVCPAHGPGSVCAGDIGERMWTTVGLERLYNDHLQVKTKAEFIERVAKKLEYAPYFRQVERMNLDGASAVSTNIRPMSLTEFVAAMKDAIVLDTRMETGFSASHIPGSIFIWASGVPSFAGWFLPSDRPILLLNETNDSSQVARYLIRLGFDNIVGFLSGGILAWQMAGKETSSIKTISVQYLCSLIDQGEKVFILDIRSDKEISHSGQISGAHHIHLTELIHRIDEIPSDQTIYIFCGSGLRSMTAASLMKREGWHDIAVVLGGLSGWRSISCPAKKF